ncbi:methyl-accepting chemotaxis protein [Burkholderia glumae]|uniref:HAMP domain-containing protein n=1 Tax=Burkholderia glumae TaxID=337 RepID=A0AAQ0BT30_BURGL|nr:methyl-accepting chemotaxis protein [Burkholderia glumae]ACR30886.1 Methyl-accepting chemotaxis sensory transducer [Burkholderia glumae BGR1]AJY64017.1 methyl-accepting chemotaxis (MCP) signaling domain protein [Burkholderia glumae LMG 2196 = ATCC 33617]KHJ63793.1 chemotaxis protein [Burkholderia glumae]MCM2483803.1 methyl-accepting chemotaxis protein [Burkholderia glumae]MCM2509497.1 methyl-accepting chemotaxis protein [Burkholderia glumae]
MFSSIRARILATCVGIVATALIATGGIIYYVVEQHNDEMINSNLKSTLAGQTLAINQWIASCAKQVAVLADSAPLGSSAEVLPSLRLVMQSGGFVAVTLGLADKTAYSPTPLPAGYDPTARPWYKQAAASGHALVTSVYRDAATGKPTFSFVSPVMRDGTMKGAIAAGMLLEKVSGIVAAIRPTPSSLAFLVNQKGDLLALGNTALIMKPASDLSADLTPALLEALKTADRPLEIKIDGADKLLRSEPIDGTDWHLVLALDKADVTAGIRAVATTTLVCVIVVALLAALVIGALTTTAFRRILLVRDALNDVSSGSGDLSRRLPAEGGDEAAQIARAFNLFTAKISETLLKIRESSESVRLASSEIAQGNQDLSGRTELTASSLQETAAALEEIAGTARNSADAVTQMSQLAEKASSVAIRGGDTVREVVTTMHQITQASAEISDIIGVIDGIAFQTNILALNAAVEAARASEHGRGFAVVAGEVRALAQRSAQAAREIKALIESSVSKIEQGSQLVQTAGLTMDEIVGGVRGITNAIGEIGVGAHEQSTGLEQVNQALSQLDHSTQQNAALVEQSAASAVLLREQAEKLADAVGEFKLATA